ncbi:MAG: hypothetical protein CM15mP116_11260 [Synechococcus sp.]|nr:MAG: hypothetical protein CM15mP116_11260 [Synechococcus sp.]
MARGRTRRLQHGRESPCLAEGLRDEPGLQLDVLTHEAIHVVQDCLDGLETPSSSTISLMLQAQGGLAPRRLIGFCRTISIVQRRTMC